MRKLSGALVLVALVTLSLSACTAKKDMLRAAEGYLSAGIVAAETTSAIGVIEDNAAICIVGAAIRDGLVPAKATIKDLRINDKLTTIAEVEVNISACAPLLTDGFPSVVTPETQAKIKKYIDMLVPLAASVTETIVEGTDIPESRKELAVGITKYIEGMTDPIVMSLANWNGKIVFPAVVFTEAGPQVIPVVATPVVVPETPVVDTAPADTTPADIVDVVE